jgi:hypothetical protein
MSSPWADSDVLPVDTRYTAQVVYIPSKPFMLILNDTYGTCSADSTITLMAPNASYPPTVFTSPYASLMLLSDGYSEPAFSTISTIVQPWIPSLIGGLKLWLDAKDIKGNKSAFSGLALSSWFDKSGNTNNATLVGPSTINVSQTGISGMPAVSFTSSITSYLSGPFPFSSSNATVFTVFTPTTSASASRVLSLGTPGSESFALVNYGSTFGPIINSTYLSAPIASSDPVIGVSWIDGTDEYVSVNGSLTSISTPALENLSTSVYSLGTNTFDGNLGEVLIYNTTLTQTQRQVVEGYLAWKWGLQASLPPSHPYISSSPPVNALPTVSPPTPITQMTPISTVAGSMTVSWSGGVGATEYSFTLNGSSVTPIAYSSSYATFSGLSLNTTYTVVVTARNYVGPTNGTLVFTTAPLKPTGLSVSSVLTSSFTILWNPPSGATSYTFTLNGNLTVPSSQTSRSATFTGLSHATYSVVVNAVNSGGSTASDPLVVVPLPTIPVVSLVSSTAASLTITWTGGDDATSYTYRVNGAPATPVSGTAPTVTLGGLQPVTSYSVIVTAVNSSGFTSSAALSAQTTFTAPTTPTNVVFTNITGTSFKASWTSAGATSNTFTLNGSDATPSSFTNTTATFTGLNPSTAYDFIVTATNSAGSSTSSSYTTTTLAGQPVLTVSSITQSSFVVSWTGAQGATSFSFVLNGSPATPSSQGDSTATFSGLSSGTSYTIIVRSVTSAGANPSLPSTFPTLPGPATALTQVSATYASFVLSWSPPTGVASYSFSLGGTPTTPSSQTSSSATFTGLEASTSYTAIVISTNASGSTSSSPFTATTATAPPSSLSATSTSTSCIISWTPPAGVTSYTFRLNGSTSTPSSQTSSTATFTGLTPGTTYSFIVVSVNAYGSTASSPLSVLTAPSAPSTLTQSATTASSFVIGWAAQTGVYSYTYTLNGASTTPSSQTSRTATFTGLQGGTAYAVIVTAVNASGSTPSSSFSALTAPSAASSLVSSNVSASGLTVSWSGAAGATSFSYTLNGVSKTAFSETSSSATFAGLVANTAYAVIVRSTNSAGTTNSQPLSVSTGSSLPALPTSLASSSISESEFTVSWTGGEGATSFSYTLNEEPATPSAEGSGTATFSGLLPATSYQVIVTAVNSSGSADSAPLIVLTESSTPTSLTLTSQEATSFAVTWIGGTGATSYSFTINEEPVTPSSQTSSSASFTGLTPGSSISLVVSAINASGSSPSSPLTFTTLPNAPSNLQGTATQTSIVLTWSGAEGASSFSYTINDEPATPSTEGLGTATFTGLTAGSSYTFNVSAYNVGGSASASITLPTQPDTPVISEEAVAQTSVTVSWVALSGVDSYSYTINEEPQTPSMETPTTATFLGLTQATLYSIVVTATNTSGSTSSSPLTVYTFPGTPVVSLESVSKDTIVVSWTGAEGATSLSFTLNDEPASPDLSGNTASFTGLTLATSYTIIVTAVANEKSSPSNPFTQVTLSDLPPPVAPSSLIITDITSTGFSVSWSGGDGSSYYTFNLNSNITAADLSGDHTASWSTLTPGLTYTLVINAVNSGGITSSDPSTIVLAPGAAGMVTFSETTQTSTKASWSGGNGATSFSYTLNQEPAIPTSEGLGTATFDGLSGGTSYTLVITSINESGSTDSTGVVFITSPTPATNVVISDLTDSSATISWTQDPSTTSYSFSLNGNAFTPSTDNSLTAQNIIVDGLSGGNYFTIVITETNSGGSTDSSGVTFLTLPTAPFDLSGSDISGTQLTLTWSQPEYSVQSSYSILTNGVPDTTAVITGTSALITDLSGGNIYSFVVEAQNSSGTTSSAPFQLLTSPQAPYDLSANSITTSGFYITWKQVGIVHSYNYYLNGILTAPADVATETASFTGLTHETQYSVIVEAVNTSGVSASLVFSVSTSSLPPIQLLLLNAVGYTELPWIDDSGRGMHAILDTGASILNSDLNGIVLDGASSWTFSNIQAGNRWSINLTYRQMAVGIPETCIVSQIESASHINLSVKYIDSTHLAICFFNGEWVCGTYFELPMGVWTNIQGTWNGSNLITYINGHNIGSTSSELVSLDSGNSYIIGKGFNGTDFVVGEIGKIAIYNYTLTQEEIKATFWSPVYNGIIAPQGLVYYFQSNNSLSLTPDVPSTISSLENVTYTFTSLEDFSQGYWNLYLDSVSTGISPWFHYIVNVDGQPVFISNSFPIWNNIVVKCPSYYAKGSIVTLTFVQDTPGDAYIVRTGPRSFVTTTISYLLPTSIPGLAMWFDGADTLANGSLYSQTNITTWKDKSLSGFHATASGVSTASARGIVPENEMSQTVFLPLTAVSMSQTSFQATIPSGLFIDELDIYVVYKNTELNTYNTLVTVSQNNLSAPLDINNSSRAFGLNNENGYASSYNLYNTNLSIFNLNFSQTKGTVSEYSNGSSVSSQVFTSNTPSSTGTTFYIGTRADGVPKFTGQMCEILVFSQPLLPRERQILEGYLAWKWNLQAELPSLHPFYTVPPTLSTPLVAYQTFSWQPTDISGCGLWLDGADSGLNTPLTWTDKSGRGNNYTQDTPTWQPSFSSTGVNFPANTGLYPSNTELSPFQPTNSWTIIAAFSGTGNIFRLYNDSPFVLMLSQNNLTVAGVSTATSLQAGLVSLSSFPNNFIELYNNGTTAFTQVVEANMGASTGLTLGSYNASEGVEPQNSLVGTLYEFIVYPFSLSDSQRQTVEGYLAWKWGMQAKLPSSHPHFTVPPGPITVNPNLAAILYVPLSNNILDSSMLNQTVVATGSPTFMKPVSGLSSRIGYYMNTSSLKVENSQPGQNLSFGFWYYAVDSTTTMPVKISTGISATQNSVNIEIISAYYPYLNVYFGSTLYSASFSLPLTNTWTHIAATVDCVKGVATLFVNGSQVGTCGPGTVQRTFFSNNINLISGTGTMREFCVFEEVLSPIEILSLTNSFGVPLQVDGCTGWFDSKDSSTIEELPNNVAWEDKSPTENTLINSDLSNNSVYQQSPSGVYGLFSASSFEFASKFLPGYEFTIFIVFQAASDASGQMVFSNPRGISSGTRITFGSTTDVGLSITRSISATFTNKFNILCLTMDYNSFQLYNNGSLIGQNDISGHTWPLEGIPTLLGPNIYYFEFISYKKKISESSRTSITQYLQTKWLPSVSAPYKSWNPTQLPGLELWLDAADGNTLVYDTSGTQVPIPPGTQTLFSGVNGGIGYQDGSGSTALFYTNGFFAIDSLNNLLVADTLNNVIRKITPDGTASTFCGNKLLKGFRDGDASGCIINSPTSISYKDGYVYFIDNAYVCIRRVNGVGAVETVIGYPINCHVDGLGDKAVLLNPYALATGPDGTMYIGDATSICTLTPQGQVTYLIGGGLTNASAQGNSGPGTYADGSGAAVYFYNIRGLAFKGTDLYISDQSNHVIRKMDSAGNVTTFAGIPGSAGALPSLCAPTQLCVGIDGLLYIANQSGNNILRCDMEGNLSVFAGDSQLSTGFVDGPSQTARFYSPMGICADTLGNFYVTDYYNNAVRKITQDGTVSTIISETIPYPHELYFSNSTLFISSNYTGNVYTWNDGTTEIYSSGLNAPTGITGDSNGNIYVAEYNNNTITKISSSEGNPKTILAGAIPSAYRFTQGTDARLYYPGSLVNDSSGNLFFIQNQQIVKADSSFTLSSFAGTSGQYGYLDATGLAARFYNPASLAIDNNNNIYVSDYANHVIRKITPQQVVTTVEVNSSFYERIVNPYYISFNNNKLYISDDVYNRYMKVLNLDTKSIISLATPLIYAGTMVATQVDSSGTLFACAAPHSFYTINVSGSTNGGEVSVWKDKSGHYRNFTSQEGPQAVLYGLNNLTTVGFNGSNVLVGPTLQASSSSQLTLAAVVSANSTTPLSSTILSLNHVGSFGNIVMGILDDKIDWKFTQMTANSNAKGGESYNIVVIHKSFFQETLYINGNLSYTTTSSQSTIPDGSYLVNLGSNAYNNLAEMVVLKDQPFQLYQREALEGYLAWKWSLQVNLPLSHPYLLNAPTLVASTPPLTQSTWSPKSIPGLLAWLDTSTSLVLSGSNVIGITDKSGNGNDATSSSPLATVAYINGLPAVSPNTSKFTGPISARQGLTVGGFTVFTVLLINGTSVQTPFSIDQSGVAVQSAYSRTNGQNIGLYDTQFYYSYTGVEGFGTLSKIPQTNTGFIFMEQRQSNSYRTGTNDWYIQVNQTNSPGLVEYNSYTLGGGPGSSNPWNGIIAETLIYDTYVDDTSKTVIAGYLAWKWGLQGFLPPNHPFGLSAPNASTKSFAPFSLTNVSQATSLYDSQNIFNNNSLAAEGQLISSWANTANDNYVGQTLSQTDYNLIPSFTQGGISFSEGKGLNGTIFRLTEAMTFVVVASLPAPGSQEGSYVYQQGFPGIKCSPTRLSFTDTVGSYTLSSTPTQKWMAVVTMDLNTIKGYYNGIRTFTNANQFIGDISGTYNSLVKDVSGLVYEVALFNDYLTDSERQLVEGALASKWNINLPSNHPYYKKSPGLFTAVLANPVGPTPAWSPLSIPLCKLWLDSSSTSYFGFTWQWPGRYDISSWTDRSGNNNTAVPSNPAYSSTTNVPSYNLSRKSVSFDGKSQYFNLPNGTLPANNQPFSYFIVASFASSKQASGLIGGGSMTANNAVGISKNGQTVSAESWGNELNASSIPDQKKVIIEYIFDPSGVRLLLVNGVLKSQDQGTYNIQGTSNNFIGRTANPLELMHGDIYEVLVYSSSLTASQRKTVEGYLAWKWNMNSELNTQHPFYTSQPQALLAAPFNVTELSGVSLWLDSNTYDISGAGPNTWMNQATLVPLTGTPSDLNASIPLGASSATIAFVYNSTQQEPLPFLSWNTTSVTAGSSISWQFGTGIASPKSYSPIDDASGVLVIIQKTGTREIVYVNGVEVYVTDVSGSLITSSSTAHLNTTAINLEELVVINGSLLAFHRNVLEGYLAWKWGLSGLLPSTHIFKNQGPDSTTSLTPSSFPAWNPTTIQGMILWLDGADGANLSQTTWSDKSGSNNHGTIQTGSAYIMPREGLVLLGGTSIFVPVNVPQTSFSLFIVQEFTLAIAESQAISIAGGNLTVGIDSTSGLNVQTSLGNSGLTNYLTKRIICLVASPTTVSMYIDGVLLKNYSNTLASINSLVLGTNWFGSISEVLVYNSTITISQRQVVEGYLATKWNLQQNLPVYSPYHFLAPTPSTVPVAKNTFLIPDTWSPDDISGVKLWLDSADVSGNGWRGSSVINTWVDKSTNGNNALAQQGATVLVGPSGVVFNGSGGMNLPDGSLTEVTGSFTILMSFSPTSSNAGWMFAAGSAGINSVGTFYGAYGPMTVGTQFDGSSAITGPYAQFKEDVSTAPGTSVPIVYCLVFNASSKTLKIYLNGSLVSSYPWTVQTPLSIRNTMIGNNSIPGIQTPFPFSGYLQELISYGVALTQEQRQMAEGYLAWRWSSQRILPAGHPFNTVPPLDIITDRIAVGLDTQFYNQSMGASVPSLFGSSYVITGGATQIQF